ncbi:helix-turn-helix domain-containing protein [uncultured Secundilactobacillus sp.]|uniref:helix-turn-helix domain-containing protein n=1 Tax=uncultured Secundilactobacillus sp. TaxID=2813935 RepID=UPI0025886FDD|nr:helix-turn-helix transcriptional regulator [uncultured Secundilactobacillus sp.]
MNFAEKLKHCREDTNLTQLELAEKLHVSRKTISSWENERSFPDANSLVQLSDIYHVSVDDLIRDDRLLEHYEEKEKRDKLTDKLSIYSYWVELLLWIMSYFELLAIGGFHFPLLSLLLIINSVVFLVTFTDWKRFSNKRYLMMTLLVFLGAYAFHVVITIFAIGSLRGYSIDYVTGYILGKFVLITVVTTALTIVTFFSTMNLTKK